MTVSYSDTAEIAGRTYVHSTVKTMGLSQITHKMYYRGQYEEGGQFKPHKTHRNGLSVDFMVPVTNKKGESVHLPTHYFNKLGYAIEFDKQGNYKEYKIDFEAMAAHIVSLHKAALKNDVDLWRVLFDPKLQPYLLKTKYGEYLEKHIQFSKKQSWVRHDEHYHIDFDIPCE